MKSYEQLGDFMKTGMLLISLLILFSSCATTGTDNNTTVLEIPEAGDMTEIQKDLVDSAEWALGRNRLEIQGRRFNLDCSGVVLAVYYRSGIDLQSYIRGYTGGGVQRLYALMEENELLYKQPHLAPGDMLFWDNTYDKNKDGKKNDSLTHVGMVVYADKNGNIQYIHHNYRLGIVLAEMNLLDPDNLELNSPMRARDAEPGHAPLWLSSHLLKNAARAYEISQ